MTSLEVISLAGSLSGVLDPGRHFIVVMGPCSCKWPPRARSAFQRGKKATTGLFFHSLIPSLLHLSIIMSRRLTALLDYPLFSGAIYGSAVSSGDESHRGSRYPLIIHMFCVACPSHSPWAISRG